MTELRDELFGADTVIHNGPCYCELGAPHELCELIAARGYTVVNAPRPLACYCEPVPDARQRNFEWVRLGLFYAAGPANGPAHPFGTDGRKLHESWRADGARSVRLTTNVEVEAGLRAYFAKHCPESEGYPPFDEAVDEWGGMASICDSFRLPWRE